MLANEDFGANDDWVDEAIGFDDRRNSITKFAAESFETDTVLNDADFDSVLSDLDLFKSRN